MEQLPKQKIERILFAGKLLTDLEITVILNEFEKEQPDIYRAIYGEFSDAIAEENVDMSRIFLELCFDVIWIYRKAFGKPPKGSKTKQTVIDSLTLLNPELQALCDDVPMHGKLRRNLQDRFVTRSLAAGVQLELLQVLSDEVDKYASFKKERVCAVQITSSLLFVIVRLMDDLYCRNKR